MGAKDIDFEHDFNNANAVRGNVSCKFNKARAAVAKPAQKKSNVKTGPDLSKRVKISYEKVIGREPETHKSDLPENHLSINDVIH